MGVRVGCAGSLVIGARVGFLVWSGIALAVVGRSVVGLGLRRGTEPFWVPSYEGNCVGRETEPFWLASKEGINVDCGTDAFWLPSYVGTAVGFTGGWVGFASIGDGETALNVGEGLGLADDAIGEIVDGGRSFPLGLALGLGL